MFGLFDLLGKAQGLIQSDSSPDGTGNSANLEGKQAFADTAIEKLKEKKGPLGKLKLSILSGRIKDYLITDNPIESLNDGPKGLIVKALMSSKEKITINGVEYTGELQYLEAAKKAITEATKDELAKLKDSIDLSDYIDGTTNTANIDTDIDLTGQSEEVKNIVDKLTIKGKFADISSIEDKDGNTIIECSAETPYANAEIIGDLVALALDFYAKNKKSLKIVSAYRTWGHQAKLVQQNANQSYVDRNGVTQGSTPTAPVGSSRHQIGMAIDINVADTGMTQTEIDAMMAEHNFQGITSESWHFNHQKSLDMTDTERLALSKNMNTSFTPTLGIEDPNAQYYTA